LTNLQRIIVLFIQKIIIKLSKIWVWGHGSGPDPGSATLLKIMTKLLEKPLALQKEH
jgi:hypothetical protein